MPIDELLSLKKTVSDFAKKTGDYRNLSAVDLKVMALTYQLEKEANGTGHIKVTPDRKVIINKQIIVRRCVHFVPSFNSLFN